MTSAAKPIDLSSLDDQQFESLVYDILEAEGWQNLNWRSGSWDGGRDIVGDAFVTDISGVTDKNSWFCDAKLYSRGVPWDKIAGTFADAVPARPDYLLIVAYPHLTTQCKDKLDEYQRNNKPTFKIRIWEKKDIEEKLRKHTRLLRKHLPSAWSEEIEMEEYLREMSDVLSKFLLRVQSIWKNPDGRPYADLMALSSKVADKPRVAQFDICHRLSKTEHKLTNLCLQGLEALQMITGKVLNLPDEYSIYTKFSDIKKANTRILVILPKAAILRSDIEDNLTRLIKAYDEKEYHKELARRGILPSAINWKPMAEKNRLIVYFVLKEDIADDASPIAGPTLQIHTID